MKTWLQRVYVLSAIFLMAGCVVGERHEATIQRHWPASAIHNVEVVGVDGSLNIEAGPPNEISLVAHVRSVGIVPRDRAENQGYFDTELSGDTLRIGQQKERIRVGFPFVIRSKVSVDYDLRVPPAVALDLKMVNGRVQTRGVDGACEVTTVNGPIDIETAGNNELSARTVNGSVHAKFLRDFRGARLKTVNGGVHALLPQTASFTCDLSQVNGDFEASFPLSIHSNPGSRRVSGQVNGGQFELQITTVNGDVEVQHLPQPPTPPAPPSAPQPPATPAAPAPPRT
jgi:putative adhesin